MQTIKTFRDLIDKWPNLGAFAEAIGVPYVNAQQMRFRNGISTQRWARLEKAAHDIGVHLTTSDIVAIAERSAKVRAAEREEKKRQGVAA